jgi:DNA-binding NtrC family response regulator
MSNAKRLLIVDDEETLTFSLYQTFIKAPIECEVLTAASGEAAVARIEEKPFDLVITDLAMPGLSGLELLQYIKKIHPQTPVILITAYGSDERKEKALQWGAAGYLEKPFDIHEIRDLVINMLR